MAIDYDERMNILRDLLQNQDKPDEDIKSFLREFVIQPDSMGNRAIADYAQPCDYIRSLKTSLDSRAASRLLINVGSILHDLEEQDVKERPEYVVQLILIGVAIDPAAVEETLHLLEKANDKSILGAEDVYNTVLGAIVGTRYELPSGWWEVQANKSQSPMHLFSAYIHREGWVGVRAALDFAKTRRKALCIDDICLLISIAKTLYGFENINLEEIMERIKEYKSSDKIQLEQAIGGEVIGRAIAKSKDYEDLASDFLTDKFGPLQVALI